MANAIALHEGVIRPGRGGELESFRAPDRRVSSYYLDLGPQRPGNGEATLRALKNALARERKRIDQLDVRPAVRHALRHDWELVAELAPTVIGERHTLGLACFVASDSGYGRALRLPWPVRSRAFFEDGFVLWPLQQILDQSDRYGLILTDKDDARLFLYFQGQIEELARIKDPLPGRIRFPDPIRNWHYTNKHVEYFHRHFEHAAEAALRQYTQEPFEHLIIGGLWETLPQFEAHLHRYLRDRVVARWDIDVQHTPALQVGEKAHQQEQQFLQRQAREVWKAIQDQLRKHGAVGAEAVFAALWGRRVQTLLIEPGVARPGYRCTACGRLTRNGGPCPECGGETAEVADAYDEAVREAIEQSAQVRYWNDPALSAADAVAAFRRY
jgi:peptide chain release factor subunit 1